jgi:hypothetical protein
LHNPAHDARARFVGGIKTYGKKGMKVKLIKNCPKSGAFVDQNRSFQHFLFHLLLWPGDETFLIYIRSQEISLQCFNIEAVIFKEKQYLRGGRRWKMWHFH